MHPSESLSAVRRGALVCALAVACLTVWSAGAVASSRATMDLKAYKAAERAARKGIVALKPAMDSAGKTFTDKANQCPGVLSGLANLPKSERDSNAQQVGMDLTAWVITTRLSVITGPLDEFESQLRKLGGGSVDPVLRKYARAQLTGYRALSGPTDPDLCADLSAWAASGFTAFSAEEQAIQAWFLRLVVSSPSARIERRFKADLRKHGLKRGNDETLLSDAILPQAQIEGDLTAMVKVLLGS
jgi:hypothetical protein